MAGSMIKWMSKLCHSYSTYEWIVDGLMNEMINSWIHEWMCKPDVS